MWDLYFLRIDDDFGTPTGWVIMVQVKWHRRSWIFFLKAPAARFFLLKVFFLSSWKRWSCELVFFYFDLWLAYMLNRYIDRQVALDQLLFILFFFSLLITCFLFICGSGICLFFDPFNSIPIDGDQCSLIFEFFKIIIILILFEKCV